MPTNLISRGEAQRLLQRSRTQLQTLVRKGLLNQYREGKQVRYDRNEVLDLKYAYDTIGRFSPTHLSMSLLVAKVNRLDRDVRLLMRIQGLEKPRVSLSPEEALDYYNDAVAALVKDDRLELHEVQRWADFVLRLDEAALIRVFQATGDPFPPMIFYRLTRRLFTEVDESRDKSRDTGLDLVGMEEEVSRAHRHILGLAAMFVDLDLNEALRRALHDRLEDPAHIDDLMSRSSQTPKK